MRDGPCARWPRDLVHGMAPPSLTLRHLSVVRAHGLAPLAHARCATDDPVVRDHLRREFQQAVGGHLRTRSVLPHVAAVLDGLRAPWAVIKGPVLSELAHPVPGVRPYADLDLLVLPEHFPEAVCSFRAAGWLLLDRHHGLVRERRPGELHLTRRGTQMDLHWSPFNMATTRADYPNVTRDLLAARREVLLGGHRTWTLSPEDLLVHTALHAALSGADRLLPLVDVDGLLRRDRPSWDRLVERAHAWGAGPATALVLSRTSRVLATTVPRELVAQLSGGRTWPLVAAAVDRLWPVQMRAPGPGIPRLVARSSRPTQRACVRELFRRSGDFVRSGARASSDASATEDLPDERALDDYLRWVSRQGRAA